MYRENPAPELLAQDRFEEPEMPKKRKPKKVVETRRPRGTGSSWQKTDGSGWEGKVPVGKEPDGVNPKTGRPKTKTVYRWFSAPTQREVESLMKGAKAPAPTITISEWLDRWLGTSTAEKPTRDLYRAEVDLYLKPQFGPILLRELTTLDVERAAAKLSKPDGPLGPNTLRRVWSHFASALESARRAKLVTENAVLDAKKVKGRKVVINPFTAVELKALVATAAPRSEWHLFALLGSVGCRIGEGLALDVEDFDAARWSISITKTYDRKHGLRRPKSETGRRTVRVPLAARPAILGAIGDRTSGPLFLSPAGARLLHETVRQRWRRFLAHLGYKYRNPHQLRHSVATHSLAAGTALTNVARDLGDTVQTVVATYLHATDGPDVCDAMDRLLGGDKVATGPG